MKVSSFITNYVRRKVQEKFLPKYKELEKEYDKEKNDIIAVLNEQIRRYNEECVKILTDAGFDIPKRSVIQCDFNRAVHKDAVESSLLEQRRALIIKEQNAVDTILIGLELGEVTASTIEGAIASVEV